MSILKVARMGHPALRVRARPIEKSELQSPAVQKLIDDMIETMGEYHGVGLAAPQVHERLRLFVAMVGDFSEDRDPESRPETVVLINPEIETLGSGIAEDWEGCLSIPDLRGRVPRATAINVRALDRRGSRVELEVRDFSARVIQHESDHLDGVLFLDRMTSFDSLTFLEEFGRFWAKDRD